MRSLQSFSKVVLYAIAFACAAVMAMASLFIPSGCSDGHGELPTDSGTSGSTLARSARIIDNEDMTSGLQGVDADKNGIRDDIDRLIVQRYALTPAMKKAAEQEARALEAAIEATTKAEARAAGDQMMRAGDCSYKVFPHGNEQEIRLREQMSKEIEALTANTPERFKAYWNSAERMEGAMFLQGEEPVCD